jgi:acyl carrier protein
MDPNEQLKNAFSQALGLPAAVAYESLAYGSTQGWDSVAHMGLVAEIENSFDIMLATDDVIDLSSFPKAKEILGKYGIQFHA